MVRAGAHERRARRPVGRRGRRRRPALLYGTSSATARGDAERRPAGASIPVRFRGHEGGLLVTLPVAILAGGRATRLGDLTKDTPKSLVEVAGRPFIAHQLDLLRRHGIT